MLPTTKELTRTLLKHGINVYRGSHSGEYLIGLHMEEIHLFLKNNKAKLGWDEDNEYNGFAGAAKLLRKLGYERQLTKSNNKGIHTIWLSPELDRMVEKYQKAKSLKSKIVKIT